MKILYHDRFKKNLHTFDQQIQQKLKKQIAFLAQDIRHPSLHCKKYDEMLDIWQARVDINVRFYFSIENDTYILLDIKKHS